MPFWWNRRKRWWRGARRPWYKRTRYSRRYRRRIYKNRRRRPTRRRRRRRRTKVRRKRQTIPVRQWQPERIVRCKIKGISVIVLGGEGKQFQCYTNEATTWTPLRTPGGGGFGVEKYTLSHLYDQYKFGNNIWTKTNILTDLVQYLGCKFVFYRHQYVDFIVKYSRNLPMTIEKLTYPHTHPQALLLSRHKRIIPSRVTKPHGKNRVIIKIKPTRVVLKKWFFQETFDTTGLCSIYAAACDLNYPHIGATSQNQIITLFGLNQSFYSKGNWGAVVATGYQPYPAVTTFQYKTAASKQTETFNKPTTYDKSVSYTEGWFNPKLMQLTEYVTQPQLAKPVLAFRYNAQLDNGKGNSVWFKSILTEDFSKPKVDSDLIISDMPIWQALYGFTDFIKAVKPDPNFLASYILVIETRFVEPFSSHATGNYWVPIDTSFVTGKGPYNTPIGDYTKTKWFPTVKNQQESINAFVKAGPYIPRLQDEKKSTWELHAFYQFYLKWGGTYTEETQVADPSKQGTYVMPSFIQEKLQIVNPAKQKAAAMLHCWDYRRGLITQSAIKRICEDQPTDTDFQTGSESSQPLKKKKKTTKELPYPPKEKEELQKCLLSLYEESISQEIPQTQNLQELIQQQQQQQQQLKYNILKIISELKQQQQLLGLQTGLVL